MPFDPEHAGVRLGLILLTLGAIHYISARDVSGLAITGWLGLSGAASPVMPPGGPSGAAYFFWASFPSFAASGATVLLFTPMFKPGECFKLCAGTMAAYSFFEVVQAFEFVPGPIGGRFDFLDLAALALGACAATLLAALLRKAARA